VPLDGFSYSHLSDSLKEKATLDTAVVDDYLKKRKLVKAAATISAKKESSKAIIASPAWKLSNDNLAALERFMEGLKLKAYSSSTHSYLQECVFTTAATIKEKASAGTATRRLTPLFYLLF
jgi:integrase/recombinase XerD